MNWIFVGVIGAFFVYRFVTNRRRAAVAKGLIDGGALLIDVRTPGEFASGHLPQAKNIPLQEIAGRLKEIEKGLKGKKDAPVVVYCRSGARSGQAQHFLTQSGFTQVVNGGAFSSLS
jgi:phage shock protein E